MASDIEIAQAAIHRPIAQIADQLHIPEEALEPYGRIKGKVNLDWLLEQPIRDSARMVLVTAISPTPAGEGKTTTTVGLGDALKQIGKHAVICLREPSLGPVFGMKGGAAGGGHAQVIPMEDINLHFNGDLHAIGVANNLLAALLDNHVHHGNPLGIKACSGRAGHGPGFPCREEAKLGAAVCPPQQQGRQRRGGGGSDAAPDLNGEVCTPRFLQGCNAALPCLDCLPGGAGISTQGCDGAPPHDCHPLLPCHGQEGSELDAGPSASRWAWMSPTVLNWSNCSSGIRMPKHVSASIKIS